MATTTREPKDLRYRREFFPNAETMIFDTKTKGFVPLPILFRKLIRHLSAAEISCAGGYLQAPHQLPRYLLSDNRRNRT